MTEQEKIGKVEGAPVDKLLAAKGKTAVFMTGKISLIRPSPANPRTAVEGPAFDELARSIERSGVLEPIIIRPAPPIEAGKRTKVPAEYRETAFEVVAGHRRLAAAKKIGLLDIPCVVVALNDAEAREVGLVENLQRKDLGPLEEAKGFDEYLRKIPGNFTNEAIEELADKVGKPARFIRTRISILQLPGQILRAWESGKVSFALLLQLLRVPKVELEAKVKEVLGSPWMTAERLCEQIDRAAIPLWRAKFEVAGCAECTSNSLVQRNLFGLGHEKTFCYRPKCFIDKQINSLRADWKETDWAKKWKTNGPSFLERFDRGFRGVISPGRIPEKCADCKDFVTLLSPALDVRAERACVGKEGCFDRATKETPKTNDAAPARKPGEARCAWHGPFFRDVFLFSRLPDILGKAPVWKKDGPGTEIERTLLFGLARERWQTVRPAVEKALGIGHGSDVGLYRAIINSTQGKFQNAITAAVSALILDEEPREGNWSGGFGRECRAVAGELFGIRLDLDYTVDETYLAKKTRAETIEFVRKFKLDKEKAFVAYLAKKFDRKSDELEKMKKGELGEAILKSGVPLRGKVPDEVLGKVKK